MMTNLADQLQHMRGSEETGSDTLIAQLEQMRIRMNEAAKRESHLAAELNAAVKRMDDELLHEVRSIAAGHEARRANILRELQAFAAQLDRLPYRHQPRPALGDDARSLLSGLPRSARPPVENDDKQRTIGEALTRLLTQQRASQ